MNSDRREKEQTVTFGMYVCMCVYVKSKNVSYINAYIAIHAKLP